MIEKIHLPTTFNQDECQSVYDEIKRHLTKNKGLVIAASNVERVGTAGIQILMSAGILCKKNEQSCVLEAPSPALLEALEQLGCISFVKDLGMIP